MLGDGNSEKLKPECKVYVRTFPGAATQYLADCMKPSIRMKLNQFILHVATIDLNSNAP